MNETTLRKLVWEEMLYADMRANYFGELVRRYLLLDSRASGGAGLNRL